MYAFVFWAKLISETPQIKNRFYSFWDLSSTCFFLVYGVLLDHLLHRRTFINELICYYVITSHYKQKQQLLRTYCHKITSSVQCHLRSKADNVDPETSAVISADVSDNNTGNECYKVRTLSKYRYFQRCLCKCVLKLL